MSAYTFADTHEYVFIFTPAQVKSIMDTAWIELSNQRDLGRLASLNEIPPICVKEWARPDVDANGLFCGVPSELVVRSIDTGDCDCATCAQQPVLFFLLGFSIPSFRI